MPSLVAPVSLHDKTLFFLCTWLWKRNLYLCFYEPSGEQAFLIDSLICTSPKKKKKKKIDSVISINSFSYLYILSSFLPLYFFNKHQTSWVSLDNIHANSVCLGDNMPHFVPYQWTFFIDYTIWRQLAKVFITRNVMSKV